MCVDVSVFARAWVCRTESANIVLIFPRIKAAMMRATRCNSLQHAATRCNSLQHTESADIVKIFPRIKAAMVRSNCLVVTTVYTTPLHLFIGSSLPAADVIELLQPYVESVAAIYRVSSSHI